MTRATEFLRKTGGRSVSFARAENIAAGDRTLLEYLDRHG
jgi:hypothetical protein